MKINNKYVVVFSVKLFADSLICVMRNTETKRDKFYEISQKRFDLKEMLDAFKFEKFIFCGYENKSFDNVMISYLFLNHMKLNSMGDKVVNTLMELKRLKKWIFDPTKAEEVNVYKFAKTIDSIDLCQMLFSDKTKVSLSSAAASLKVDKIVNFELVAYAYDNKDAIDDALKAQVKNIETILENSEEEIKLRLNIEERYGIKCLSSNGLMIGKDLLKKEYLEYTKKKWSEIKDLKTPCKEVCLGDLVLPIISLDDNKSFLKKIQSTTINIDDDWKASLSYGGQLLSLGKGGIHSINDPEVFYADEGNRIINIDVTSMFPSIAIEYDIYPTHLGHEFIEVYEKIKDDRVAAKESNDEVKSKLLKMALVSTIGLMANKYSWMYDPKNSFKIRLNAQLMLLMVGERLVNKGFKIVNWNTDGLFFIAKDDSFIDVVKDMNKLLKLDFVIKEYNMLIQYSVNDYIAISKDETIRKGMFSQSYTVGKQVNNTIIYKAIEDYFYNNIPVEETIKTHKDFYDFISFIKCNKNFIVKIGNNVIGNENRVYYSVDGQLLSSQKTFPDTVGKNDLILQSPVTLVNNLPDDKIIPSNLDYETYIRKANKIISTMKNKQLNLFEL